MATWTASDPSGPSASSCHASGGEVAIPGIAHHQGLAFQLTANPLGDGTGQLGEFTISWRFNPAKPCRSVINVNVRAVQKEHVEVDIEIKSPPKYLLNQAACSPKTPDDVQGCPG